jgi:hypothetical protein
MENLTKKQAENLSRALQFYAHYFEGFTINWFKFKFKDDEMIFYCTDKFGNLFWVYVPYDKYFPINVSVTENGESEPIYFGNKLQLLDYLNK